MHTFLDTAGPTSTIPQMANPHGDPHLNLFYSYHTVPCENNLTRAFIHTLWLLPGATRTQFLRLLSDRFEGLEFAGAKFALQRPVKNASEYPDPDKHIVAIATKTIELEGQAPQDEDHDAIPDAWIYSKDSGERSYCLLIECKRGDNLQDEPQILRHAWEHFGLTANKVKDRMISLTWHDVLRAVDSILTELPADAIFERRVLENLVEYLGFEPFGYRLFRGFHFSDLRNLTPPAWQLCRSDARRNEQ